MLHALMNEASKNNMKFIGLVAFQELDNFLIDYLIEIFFSDFSVEPAKNTSRIACSQSLIRHSFLNRGSLSSSLVISRRLRTPLIRIIMKDLKMPSGFLGGLPGHEI